MCRHQLFPASASQTIEIVPACSQVADALGIKGYGLGYRLQIPGQRKPWGRLGLPGLG